MDIYIVLMICGLFNITFLICGYKIGTSKQIITISKGDKVEQLKKYEDFADEEASYNTPEEEKAYDEYLKRKSQVGV